MSKNWNPKASTVTSDEFAIIEAEERLVYETQKAVRALLKERGLSDAELADALEVTPARVSQMMSGSGNLTLRTIARIYHVLGTRACVLEAPLAEAKPAKSRAPALGKRVGSDSARDLLGLGSWAGIETYEDVSIAANAEYGTSTVWIMGEHSEPTITPLAHVRRPRDSAGATLKTYESIQKVLVDA